MSTAPMRTMLGAVLFFIVAGGFALAGEVNLIVMGDWGTGSSAQHAVARALARYAQSQTAPMDAVLLAGDNFYVPLQDERDPAWQELFEQMYDSKALPMPFYAVLGNHDYEGDKPRIEQEYARSNPSSRWKMPGRWYRVDFSTNATAVTVIGLDSNYRWLREDWTTQRTWLRQQLHSLHSAANKPWTVCFAHHPLQSRGVHGGSEFLRTNWGGLFRKYRTDFYMAGHDHILQHTVPPGQVTSHIVSGGGGAMTYPVRRNESADFAVSRHGFVHLRFTDSTAEVRFVDAEGKILHAFQRDRAGEVRGLDLKKPGK
jgi:tartrate-resistant acid phosphatase type 5